MPVLLFICTAYSAAYTCIYNLCMTSCCALSTGAARGRPPMAVLRQIAMSDVIHIIATTLRRYFYFLPRGYNKVTCVTVFGPTAITV